MSFIWDELQVGDTFIWTNSYRAPEGVHIRAVTEYDSYYNEWQFEVIAIAPGATSPFQIGTNLYFTREIANTGNLTPAESNGIVRLLKELT